MGFVRPFADNAARAASLADWIHIYNFDYSRAAFGASPLIRNYS